MQAVRLEKTPVFAERSSVLIVLNSARIEGWRRPRCLRRPRPRPDMAGVVFQDLDGIYHQLVPLVSRLLTGSRRRLVFFSSLSCSGQRYISVV